MIVFSGGAYGYYNQAMSTAFNDLKGKPGARRRPDALLVDGKVGLPAGSLFANQLFELKPSSAEQNSALATQQIGDYLVTLAGKGISAGNSRMLVPAETYLGSVLGENGKQLRVYVYGSDIPGLVLYRLENEGGDDDGHRVPDPFPIPVLEQRRQRKEAENFEREFRPAPVGLAVAASATFMAARILGPALGAAIETRMALAARGY